MANHPQELARDAVCQSHTGHMTGLWFLPARLLTLNTNEWMNSECVFVALDVYSLQMACAILYCRLWPVRLYNINGTNFEKETLWGIKCVFWFSLQLLCETFLILIWIQRNFNILVRWSSCKVPVIRVRFLMKLEFSWYIFEKYPNINFHENPSSGSRVFPCGRTDRQDESNSRFLQFWERG